VSLTTPAETIARKEKNGRSVHKLVQFNCGQARPLGFDARDELDDNEPENIAHANVYDAVNPEGVPGKRKAEARKLSQMCIEVAIVRSR